MSPLSRLPVPGLFITGTDTGVGKTLIAGAICHWFRRNGYSVGACKIAATGCVNRREGLVSEDAEFLAHCSGTRQPLDVVCPQRFVEPLAPAVAAERAGKKLDWGQIDRSLQTLSQGVHLMVVEGVGGVMVPMDAEHLLIDVAESLRLPTVVVARPGLGTINHTLLTVAALRSRNIPVAGVVINRYPPETPDVAEETNPRSIERWGRVKVLCLSPEMNGPLAPSLPGDIVAAIDNVDWAQIVRTGEG